MRSSRLFQTLCCHEQGTLNEPAPVPYHLYMEHNASHFNMAAALVYLQWICTPQSDVINRTFVDIHLFDARYPLAETDRSMLDRQNALGIPFGRGGVYSNTISVYPSPNRLFGEFIKIVEQPVLGTSVGHNLPSFISNQNQILSEFLASG